jgi:uncharacterized protein with PhoU and TrkA domain
MLARIIQGEEEKLDLLYEDLELKIFHVRKRSGLAGRTLEELDLPQRFGCRVVALERLGQTMAVPDKKTAVEAGDIMALMGSPKGIEAFSRRYDRRNVWKKRLNILMPNDL